MINIIRRAIILTAVFILGSFSTAFAVMVDGMGEADIINGDIPSAKLVAISRAKWAAMEKVSGVTVKLDTIMNNAQLADEAVKTELSGTIKSFTVSDEGKDGNIYWVTIKADIVPDMAKKAVGALAKNTSIAIFLPAVTPDGRQDFNQAFTQTVANELKNKGFDISGVSSYSKETAQIIEKAIATGDYKPLQAISNQTMSPTFLIGSLKVIKKSDDIGYGNAGFTLVNGELEWRLIGDKDGSKVLIDSGTAVSRSQGTAIADAAFNLYRSMAKGEAVKLASTVSQKILGENARTIKVILKGETNPQYIKEFRDDVRNTPFVLNIREDSISSLLADYPERTYYLATFLTRNNKYRVVKMDDLEIIIERR